MNVFEGLTEPYFIGEIGINHNGDLQIAKKLIDATFCCNWHCAKFQKRNPDVAVPEAQKGTMRDTPWGRMTYLAYRHRVEFGRDEYQYIDRYCREKPIDWSASIWDHDSLAFLLCFDTPFIKIPSAMMSNDELLIEAAASRRPLVMSTGMSTLEEVDHAVNLVLKHGVRPVIMHTNSSYPTPRDELNLRLIPFYAERYGCLVGYSGHEPDVEPTVLAVSIGAMVVERHITLSHEMWGTDHAASLEVVGMDVLRKRTKDISVIFGTASKAVTKSEVAVRQKLRGS
jgi:N-acetylneuraminate synthase